MVNKQSNKQPKFQVLSPQELGFASLKEFVSDKAFSLCVRSLLQNWRQGTVSSKGRSDVSYSNKKPWKQKGTGRARAGTRRSPIWRGGGVIFGPQCRVKKLSVSKKVKKDVMASLINTFLHNDKIIQLYWILTGDKPKTSAVASVLREAGLHNKKLTVFLSRADVLTYASLMNIPYVTVLFFDQGNVFGMANCDYLVFFKKDLDSFREMVSQWI